MPAISRPLALSLIPSALFGATVALELIAGISRGGVVVAQVGWYVSLLATLLVCLLAPTWELRRGGGWGTCLAAGAVAGGATGIVAPVLVYVADLVANLPLGHWSLSLVWLPDALYSGLLAGILGLIAGAVVKSGATIWRRRRVASA